MRVAQVGRSIPESVGDHYRTLRAREWLSAHGRSRRGRWSEDVVNIAENGRDFLRESQFYDIVLVHSVIDPPWGQRLASHAVANQISPRHTYAAWQQRLAATGAGVLFIFEHSYDAVGKLTSLPACMNGWNIGTIRGYHQAFIDVSMAVYVDKANRLGITSVKQEGNR